MVNLMAFVFIVALASSAIKPSLGDRAEIFPNNLPEDAIDDANLLVPDIVIKYGYPVEVHTVTTSSGYILEMHRIPFGKNSSPSANRPVVYLQHGLFTASSDWVLPGPKNGFAYVLADAGYDVWLPNCRGNRYSRKHVFLDPDKDAKTFWDFSFHELAVEDLPEMIDYVIERTGQEKIFYIGHSQGTTISYVLCSEKPEYNLKFRAIFSLSPVSYVGNMFSPPIRLVAAGYDVLFGPLLDRLGVHEMLPHNELGAKLAQALCAEESAFQPVCLGAVYAIYGFTPNQTNRSLVSLLMAHYPAGSATKQVFHFFQLINSGKFLQFDYGLPGNLEKYGSSSPPDYKHNKIVAPVYLHYSSDDWHTNMKDVEMIDDELGNSQGKFMVSGLNHLDFLFGVGVRKLVYEKILIQMAKH